MFSLIDDDGTTVLVTDDPDVAEREAEASGYRLKW